MSEYMTRKQHLRIRKKDLERMEALESQLKEKAVSECKYENCKLPKMKDPMFWGDKDISDYCGVSCYVDDLERKLEEAKKSLGDSINYRVFNLNADEAIKALRHAEQLKEQG
jgi:hypothetical protein